MNTSRLLTFVQRASVLCLIFTQASFAQPPVVEIDDHLSSDPLILNGKSGGPTSSSCGYIAATPNEVIQITKSLPYLRVTVESQGKSSLLIDGPGGRFCILPDIYSKSNPQFSGYWQRGKYLLYVGEDSEQQYDYTLSISQQEQLKK